MLVYFSVPISSISKQFIDVHYSHTVQKFKNIGYNIIDNINIFKLNGIQTINIFRISENIKLISKCNLIYFFSNWEIDILCKLEHEIASKSFISCYYESSFDSIPIINRKY